MRIGRDSTSTLKALICESLGTKNAFLFANGRGAMSFLLQCMTKEREEDHKDVVVVPSYTCYSVAASALKAGLKVLVCDIDKKTLSYDREQLESIDFNTVLAIVSSSLYGLPNDLSSLEELARAKGVYLIDDAAQCLGATVDNRAVGTFGDAGILSFDKGKVITSMNGGVIVTSNKTLSRRIEIEHEKIENQSLLSRATDLAKLQAYFILLHPSLYWIPSNLPFLKLGETIYNEDYEVQNYFEALAPIARSQYTRIDQMNEHRRLCAASYTSGIHDTDLIECISPLAGSAPVYLRYPLRIKDDQIRRQFLYDYNSHGCSVSYPASIADVPEIRSRILVHNDRCEGGRIVASQLVTLPTHAFVRESDIERICSGLSRSERNSDTPQ